MEQNEELKSDVVKFVEIIGDIKLSEWQSDFLIHLVKTEPFRRRVSVGRRLRYQGGKGNGKEV